MQTVLQSGYSSLDGTDIWVRDLAYDTAADDDVLMAWDNVYAYENGGTEIGVFKKSAFTNIQRDPDIAQDIEDEFNTEVENDERPALVESSPHNPFINDNDSVTLKLGSFIEFIVKGKVDYFNDDIIGVEVPFDGYTTEIEIPNNYEYKIITAPVIHPPVGSLVYINNIMTPYVLAKDNTYYSTTTPYSIGANDDFIKTIIVI